MAREAFLGILLGAALLLPGCSPHSPASNPRGFNSPASSLPTHSLHTHGRYTDKRLYREITAAVADGASYYAAAARLQRAHGYPLKPSVTVRLPTLAFIGAAIGWGWLRAVAFALLAAAMLAWFLALRGKVTLPERIAAAVAVGANFGMLTGDPLIIHERWAGLFLTLALALRIGRRERWIPVLALAAAAVAVRELALPFALLALAFAAWEGRRRETLAWAALVALFVGVMALHLHLVAAQVRPGDLASQGWWPPGGPLMALTAIAESSPLQYLLVPLGMGLAALPLAGWLALGGRDGWFCTAVFGGYALMFALFARPDNFYW
ncbi:MAG: hypothetical protein ABIQ81_03600, partial [Novosphingobium sp.]